MTRIDPSDSAAPAGPGAPARFAPAEIAGIVSPLVGRDAELQQLIGELYSVVEGGPARLVTVVGPAGIGKSRLAHELRQLIGRLPEPVSLLGLQADRQSTGQPYSLFRLLVAALFRIRESDPLASVAARLEHGVTLLLGPGGEERAHFIGQLAGYDFSASPHLRGLLGEPRQIRDRALHYAAQCLRAFTDQAPLVLLVDDFHYADDSSIDAFTQVVRENPALNLLVVCLAQQRLFERRPDWAEAAELGPRLELQPLDERGGRRLVAEILRKAGKLPQDLRNLIVSRAEGNPFYVEELIKMLIADGVIIPAPDAWTVQQGRLSRLRIPSTLSDLLRARIQALAPAEHRLLLRAAVVGRVFWADAALGLGEPPEDAALDALLEALEREDLVTPGAESRFPGQREYAFRHELLHEVAYDLVAPQLRAQYHARTAAWLVAHSGERAPAYAGLIAEHYERAGDTAEAARWYVRAGHHARETYAVDAAIQAYRTGLALLPPTPDAAADRIASYEGLAETQLAAARLGDAADSYLRMAEHAAATGDVAAAARAWSGHAYIQDHAVEYDASMASAERAVALAEEAGAQRELTLALFHRAWAEIRHDNMQAALAIGQRALALLEQLDDPATSARWSGLLGVIYDLRGDHERAVHFQHEALAFYRSVGNLTEVATQLNNLGATANLLGDFAGALRYLEEGQSVSRQIGSRVIEIYVLSNLGHAWNGLGQYAAAEEAARRGIELAELSRMTVFSDFYCALAEASLRQGHVVEAVEAANHALDLARAGEGPREVAAAWRALGAAMGAMSDSQGAPRCFAESARLFTASNVAGDLGRTLRAWALYELRSGDKARGLELWAQARATFAAAGFTHELARTPAAPAV
jgi:predicted ATPase